MRLIIGLSNPKKSTLISQAIKLHQNTEYAHAYIRFYDEVLNEWMVFEASHGQARYMSFSRWLSKNQIHKEYSFNIGYSTYIQILKFCAKKAGTVYGFLTIAGIFISKIPLLRLIVPYKKLKEDGNKSFICSELIVYCLNMLGINSITSKYDLKKLEYELDSLNLKVINLN